MHPSPPQLNSRPYTERQDPPSENRPHVLERVRHQSLRPSASPDAPVEHPPEDRLAAELTDLIDLIRNYVELLYERHAAHLEPDACRHLRLILRGCDRAELLADVLRRLCRASQLRQVVPELNLSEFLAAVFPQIQKTTGRQFTVDISPNLPRIGGDVELIGQMFALLTEIFIKHLPEGRPCIKVESPDGNALSVRLASNREPALRANDPSAGARTQACGAPLPDEIELLIARQIMKTLGGRLDWRTDPEGHPVFLLRFPADRSPALADASERVPHWKLAAQRVD